MAKALAVSIAIFLVSGVAAFAFTNYTLSTDKASGLLSSVVNKKTSLKITNESAAVLKENKKEQVGAEENNSEEEIHQEPKGEVAVISKEFETQINEQKASFIANNKKDENKKKGG